MTVRRCPAPLQAHRVQLAHVARRVAENDFVRMLQSRVTPSRATTRSAGSSPERHGATSPVRFSGAVAAARTGAPTRPLPVRGPRQSEPVSPPPRMTTRLPVAVSWFAPYRRPRSCSAAQKPIARWMPAARARAPAGRATRSHPPARTTASNSRRNCSPVTSTPTFVLGVKSPPPPPSAMRRSMRCFSILKSGMP